MVTAYFKTTMKAAIIVSVTAIVIVTSQGTTALVYGSVSPLC